MRGNYGCHNDRKRGDYHCHRGPMKGKSFNNKEAARPQQLNITKKRSNNIQGIARVVDGDTLEINGEKIRLHGIDSPEIKQTCRASTVYQCGQVATHALSNKIGQQPISCVGRDVDRYGRIVAICYLKEENLNSWMVSEGHAVAYRKYSKDYVFEEERAKKNKNGIWEGDFEYPWEWRKSH